MRCQPGTALGLSLQGEFCLKRFFSGLFGDSVQPLGAQGHPKPTGKPIVTRVSTSSPARKAPRRGTILLVDDDPFQAHAHRSALERHYPSIERAVDASEAFIRVAEPGFQETLGLVVVGLWLPGVAGPAFVSELRARLPLVPILVIGRPGETPTSYNVKNVQFLPRASSATELLAAVRKILVKSLRRAA
jgi:CheY-like chemotaxis protein